MNPILERLTCGARGESNCLQVRGYACNSVTVALAVTTSQRKSKCTAGGQTANSQPGAVAVVGANRQQPDNS